MTFVLLSLYCEYTLLISIYGQYVKPNFTHKTFDNNSLCHKPAVAVPLNRNLLILAVPVAFVFGCLPSVSQ